MLADFVSAVGPADQNHVVRNAGALHCPTCGDSRRMHLWARLKINHWAEPPVLATLTCVQCDTLFTAVLYKSPEGLGLAILPSTYGGLTTPNTPVGVAYYLDQAQRSQSVGANSAAVAMFRAALDHLLFEQGFKKGMCGQKLAELEAAVKANTAPKWAHELDAEFLTVMKKLGDGGHTSQRWECGRPIKTRQRAAGKDHPYVPDAAVSDLRVTPSEAEEA